MHVPANLEPLPPPAEVAPKAADGISALPTAPAEGPADPLGPLVQRSIEQALGRLSEGISAAVNAALQQVLEAQGQARRHAVPALFGPTGDGDPHKCFGDWLLHVARNDARYLEKTYGSVHAKAALGEASGTTGGYLVPPEFHQRLMAIVAEENFIRPRAFVQPMASATLQFPLLDITSVPSAGQSPFLGGVVMHWTEEAQTRVETEPRFRMMELKAHELSGYAVSSNVLLQDAALGLERFLYTLFGKAIAWYEEYAFLQGDGVGKPLGMMKAPARLTVPRAAAGDFQYADAARMLARLLPASQKRAIWVMHPYVIEKAVQLADNSGRLVWVPNIGGAQEKVPGHLFNLPIFTTQKVPALGQPGDVLLLDPSLYVIGDRMTVEIAASEHVHFLKNQMTWRVVERVDGQPWLDRPITLQDASSTVSPFVVLQ
ncbi:MAG: phage major capsid protein [Gemmataceae bacterium]|nr:phage major capsid protein [Gemmataceae bacterium]MDW8265157.1 phage major capsid protein [Gemmataceae bacterium]